MLFVLALLGTVHYSELIEDRSWRNDDVQAESLTSLFPDNPAILPREYLWCISEVGGVMVSVSWPVYLHYNEEHDGMEGACGTGTVGCGPRKLYQRRFRSEYGPT
ncbi:hypothetical protein D3C85_15740 [compost metagenome]